MLLLGLIVGVQSLGVDISPNVTEEGRVWKQFCSKVSTCGECNWIWTAAAVHRWPRYPNEADLHYDVVQKTIRYPNKTRGPWPIRFPPGPAPTENTKRRVYCFTKYMPSIGEEPYVLAQLKQCDGYNLFSDVKIKIDGDETIVVDRRNGSQWELAQNKTRDWSAMWFWIANNVPKDFDYYVKIDPDTFLRPEKLRKFLSKYEPKRKQLLGTGCAWPGVCGPLYALSNEAVNTLRDNQYNCDCPMGKPQMAWDDLWIGRCMFELGVETIDVQRCFPDGCDAGWAIQNPECIPKDAGIETLLAGKTYCNPKPCWKYGGMVTPMCINPDVVALHSFKEKEQYLWIQRLMDPASLTLGIEV